ncbi:CLUMA_CG018395, isoform A [Clunio marinus]|uniref:CLUMA_CG018395, isoform A n=1 Tax=Clunio marinus TaxID=568069 RepID=A0A1J1IXY5_9DIPT|nr:CLUMA_CG018395, isoform A [Clunio marinus]
MQKNSRHEGKEIKMQQHVVTQHDTPITFKCIMIKQSSDSTSQFILCHSISVLNLSLSNKLQAKLLQLSRSYRQNEMANNCR